MNTIDLTLARRTEDVVARYERGFRQTPTRGFLDLLPADGPERAYVLARLVRADLALRWTTTAAGPNLVGGYFEQFPELAADADALRGLLDEFRELCARAGAPLPAADLRLRFPPLAPLLDEADRATTGEGATTVDHNASTGTSPSVQVPTHLREKVGAIPTIPGYQVLRVLASGGMGYVLHGRDTGLRRDAAIKLPLGAPSEEQRLRFLREAQAAAALRHPNICQVYGVDVAGDGNPFIAMEFLDGPTLRDRIAERPFAPQPAAALLAPVARAVAYAHECKIIHRDIKPQNIILRREHERDLPVLTDFGLAKLLNDTGAEVTHSGQVMGSPAYMPPEQASGATDLVGPLADVYSLGAVLYQMLTGRPPFQGPVGEVLKKVQTEEPVPPSKLAANVHRDLETICLKCLETDPARRYGSAAALADDLERFANGEPILARRSGFVRRAVRLVRRNRVAAASLLVLLIVGAGSVLAVQKWSTWAKEKVTKADEETEITKLDREITDELARGGDWTDERLRGATAATERLAALAPDRGAEAAARVNAKLFESGAARLRAPTLDDADRAYVTATAARLQPRDAKLAAELTAALQKRVRGRVREFLVEPPGTGPGDTFDPARGGETRTFAAESYFEFGALAGDNGVPMHLTRVTTGPSAELTVKFAAGWDQHGRVGAAVSVPPSARGGYALVLAPGVPGHPTLAPPTFADARKQGAVVLVQLYRGAQLVREQAVPAGALGTGPLTVTIQRARDQVLAQVNQLPPIKYHDLFPVTGRGAFAVIGPANVRVARVEGWREDSAAVVSPLERGDELFLAGEFAAALEFYRQEALRAGASAAGSEARLKVGVALLALRRDDEAAERLRELYENRAEPLAPLAGCYLIAAHTRRKQLEAADEILDRLAARNAAQGDVLARLPEDVRNEILLPYRIGAGGLGLLRDDPGRVEKVERLVRAEEALGVRLELISWTRLQFVRSLRASSDPNVRARAAPLLRDWLGRDYPPGDVTTSMGTIIAAEYGWVTRENGTPLAGLEEVTARIFSAPRVFRAYEYQLLIERARLNAALGKMSDAEQDLRDFLTSAPLEQKAPRSVADASLMLGLLLDRRGDAAGAKAAWLAGRTRATFSDANVLGEVGGGIGMMTNVACYLLSDTLEDADFELLAVNLLKAQLGPLWSVASKKVKPEDLRALAAVMRASAKKPAGREQFWRFAFQTNSFRDYATQIVTFSGVELLREIALGGTATPEQDAVLNALVTGSLRQFAEGRLGLEQMLVLYALVQGGWTPASWAGVEKHFDPAVLGSLAYAIGHRYLRQSKFTDAAHAFRAAVAAAPAGSALKKQAEAELAKIPEKK